MLTFTPSSALSAATAYQASVSGATSTTGVTMTTPDNWSFTTSGSTACPCTIWESDATPATPSVNDSNAVELGVKFQPDDQRLDLRRPVLQGCGQHWYPYRKPVDGHRYVARPWHFH